MLESEEGWGIDIGGILIPQLEGSDTSGTSLASEEKFLALDPLPGAIEGVRWIIEERAGSRYTDLVSKAKRESTRKLTLLWLNHHDFYRRTGLNRKHVFFCPDRASKAACAKERRHTHFIDNHPGVLGLMDSVKCRILQGATDADKRDFADQLPKFAYKTAGWAETVSRLLGE